MDEMITYVYVDKGGTEMSEEYESPEVARAEHAKQEWEPKIGPLRLVRKTYVFSGTYENVD